MEQESGQTTDVVNEEIVTMETTSATYITTPSIVETVSTYIESTPATFSEAYLETTAANEATAVTYLDSTPPTFSESTTPTYLDSAPSAYSDTRLDDSMGPAYSESQLQEAELIINLSSRNRRSMTNPTLTQVNTSITGSEGYSGTHMDVQVASGDAVDVVHVEDHVDPLLEENTMTIMSQVTTPTNAELMVETVEPTSGTNDEAVEVPSEVDPDNLIVISLMDEDAGGSRITKRSRERGLMKKGSATTDINAPEPTDQEPSPKVIYIPGDSDTAATEPVPTSLIRIGGFLAQPEMIIERKKIHECVVCKKQYKSIVDLFRHRVEHNEVLKTSFNCDKCSQKFEEPEDLDKHKLTHSGHGQKLYYQCFICQDTFNMLHNYKCHLRIHNSKGPYVCNMCYRVFDKKSQFISHMDDHEFASTNPYRHRLQCNVCDKIFADSAKLKRHNLAHSGMKDFKCHICSKGFLERHKLNRHMLTHTGKREFGCSECDRTFTLKHNLTIHMRIHENIRPYQCLVCKRTFIQKIVLQRHLRIHQDYLMEQSQKFSRKFVN